MTEENDSRKNKDLTRIEELAEFLHPEDASTDQLFSDISFADEAKDEPEYEPIDEPDVLPVIPTETNFEINFETEFETNFEPELEAEAEPEFQPEPEIEPEKEIEPEIIQGEHPDQQPSEKLEEIKTFAENFSYGQIPSGGNPPFSIIIKNLKYKEDVEDILILLREFGIVNNENYEETKKNCEYGSLLIPQISEYTCIVLAHKMRRFDCDLEAGLSDEIHPLKSEETNPLGLVNKKRLQQNISESYRQADEEFLNKEILVTTLEQLEGYDIIKYLGVQSSFTVIDQDELKRLNFVDHSLRSSTTPLKDEKIFQDYHQSFEFLFTDLCDQLKAKAIKDQANALIGLNYQLNTLPADPKTCYQLVCTATLALVHKSK